jgi:hypothetical protein
MRYTVDKASYGMMYIPSFRKFGSGIQVILSKDITLIVSEATMLVLLITGNYDVRH